MRTGTRRAALTAALLLGGLVAAGCKGEPETAAPKSDSAQVSDEATEKATVVSVDKAARLLTLKDKDGKTIPVQCGPEVRNFDQIVPGLTVVVRYVKSLAVALVKPGEVAPPPSATVASGRAEPGAKPAAAVAGQATATVRVESVDLAKNVVVFTPPGGGLRAVTVKRPEGREFIKGLKPGDQVQITWTEAVAISVEKE